jgi:hypothetical protein
MNNLKQDGNSDHTIPFVTDAHAQANHQTDTYPAKPQMNTHDPDFLTNAKVLKNLVLEKMLLFCICEKRKKTTYCAFMCMQTDCLYSELYDHVLYFL